MPGLSVGGEEGEARTMSHEDFLLDVARSTAGLWFYQTRGRGVF